jgi:Leucine Rich repeat
MPQLNQLNCAGSILWVEGVRAVQPALQTNRTLKILDLSSCELRDDGIRLIADALVGNTVMDRLNILSNCITSAGLDDITRIIDSTQLKTIGFHYIDGVFDNDDATQHVVSTLQQKKSSVQEVSMVYSYDLPEDNRDASYASINNSLKRNQQLNRVAWLLGSTAATTAAATTTATSYNQQHDA